MDIYKVDSNTVRISSAWQDYISLIWTERLSDISDFEIVGRPTKDFLNFFKENTYLQILHSSKTMIVDKIVIEKEEDREAYRCIVTGSSLEQWLKEYYVPEGAHRIVDYRTPTYASHLIRAVGSQLFYTDIAARYKFPDPMPSSAFQSPGVGNIYDEWIFDDDFVFDVLKSYADIDDLGFYLTMLPTDASSSSDGHVSYGVITPTKKDLPLSVQMGTLEDESYAIDRTDYKNIARVTTQDKKRTIEYRAGVGLSPFTHKLIRVASKLKYDDYATDPAKLDRLLRTEGMAALANHRRKTLIDGKLAESTDLKSYNIGDTHPIEDFFGMNREALIREKIITSDAEGDRVYPTLEIKV